MSLWYRKNELARRYAIFYSASQLAGAFGGLLGELTFMGDLDDTDFCLAGAILSGLAGTKGLPAWKWLFLSEFPPLCQIVCPSSHETQSRAS